MTLFNTLMGFVFVVVLAISGPAAATDPSAENIRLKDLGHIEGVRDNALVGYGLVVGLAGTGDTARSGPTIQSIANTLTRLGVRIAPDQVTSRNVAAVLITSTLPPFANVGEKVDINVASIGDARSLLGGTLMLAPLKGADEKTYALAQGPVSVGGFRYDAFGNVVQKNHPTVGQIPAGATIEVGVATSIVSPAGSLYFLLQSPDYTTAARAAEAINARLPPLDDAEIARARAVDASRIAIRLTDDERAKLVEMVQIVENTNIVPDQVARIVVNERTGTVVSGGDVRMGEVSVTHGDIKVTVSTDFLVSQPLVIGRTGPGLRTTVVPDADISVKENQNPVVRLAAGAPVTDLVEALNKIKVPPRDIISILQAIRRAGSLHAELIIQ
ncbi:MAG: flagellar basal body P-ring protein FlgI [Nevskia sp.]|jgi:flagellar P-ring protein precursor FlgI|nr:flagellar basal body P-ring protein FlgI [Nevskia sp.]MCK9383347.1 flagellar basal body P-ring protein FlgI [Nevskia sp.]